MATISELAARRRAKKISLHDLALATGIEASRQCRLENGKLEPEEFELRIIAQALDNIVSARARIRELAASEGLPLLGVRL